MDILSRQASGCSGSEQWYVCTAGNFRGCCSSDPCTTGVCPDDDDSTSADKIMSTNFSTTSKPSSASKTSTTATATSSGTPESTSVEATSLQSTPSTGTATATSVPASRKSNTNGALIGGIVGGVAAFLIVALLLFFCWRRRRREKRNINMHQSVSSRSLHSHPLASPSSAGLSPTEREPLRLNGLPDRAQSTTASNANTNISGPHSVTNLSLSLPGLSTFAFESTTTLASGVGTSSTRDLPMLPPMQIPSSTSLPSATTSRRAETPQELPDTGFYRQRAELASHNQSELINVPYHERRRKDQQQYRKHKPGSRSWESSPASTTATASGHPSPISSIDTPGGTSPRLMNRRTARQVVTRDGVVLNANLESDNASPSVESTSKGKESDRSSDDHVMSFMTYGAGFEMVTRNRTKHDSPAGRTVVEEESLPSDNDVLPAYGAGDGSVLVDRDKKSPSGTMGLGMRAPRTESE